jgi:hypothetical protein
LISFFFPLSLCFNLFIFSKENIFFYFIFSNFFTLLSYIVYFFSAGDFSTTFSAADPPTSPSSRVTRISPIFFFISAFPTPDNFPLTSPNVSVTSAFGLTGEIFVRFS